MTCSTSNARARPNELTNRGAVVGRRSPEWGSAPASSRRSSRYGRDRAAAHRRTTPGVAFPGPVNYSQQAPRALESRRQVAPTELALPHLPGIHMGAQGQRPRTPQSVRWVEGRPERSSSGLYASASPKAPGALGTNDGFATPVLGQDLTSVRRKGLVWHGPRVRSDCGESPHSKTVPRYGALQSHSSYPG